MIQNQTEILVKDNSGVLKGRCINKGKRYASAGARIKVAVLKTKAAYKQKKAFKKNALQDLLLIQTKKALIRHDGSTLTFNGNKGVCITQGQRGLQLGFKRINTAVPFEVKQSSAFKQGLSAKNLIKLAKQSM